MTGPRGSRDRRPEPSPDLDKAEFERWYWTQAELRQIARGLGISTGGRKDELAARVSAALAGRPLPKEAPRRRSRLEGPLSRETVIPEGLILSRNLREWFEGEVGADFRADRHLREFLQEGAGKTLGEAVDHYRATRDQPLSEIESQFELNRFTRRWWKANPGGTRAQLLEAWRLYRETPVERRPPPS
jgi:hypothetical protein